MLDSIVKDVPPSTINGWVNNSVVTFAVNAADLIAVILLFVIVTTGVQADVASIDLIIIVSFKAGTLAKKGVIASQITNNNETKH